MADGRVLVLGGGLAGSCAALALARMGIEVDLVERHARPMAGASLHNEGKLHLGYVYAADPEASTHTILAEGSACFVDIVTMLTGEEPEALLRSRPFIYGIPVDSQLTTDEVRSHFMRVDAHLSQRAGEAHGGLIAPSRELPAHRLPEHFDPAFVQAGIETSEVAVDPEQVARFVSAALSSSERVRLHLGATVESARRTGAGFEIDCATPGGRRILSAPVVVNCLWDDRIRVDSTVGIIPARPTMLRFKAAIRFSLPHPAALRKLPSVTLVLGPYGDLVNLGNGRHYLSWYPTCKLGETCLPDAAGLHRELCRIDHDQLVRDSFMGLARFLPKLRSLAASCRDVSVGGGVIAAHGSTDITDPTSELHQRSRIGPVAHGHWITCDTGKYCTAPMFGVQAAEQAHRLLDGCAAESAPCQAFPA